MHNKCFRIKVLLILWSFNVNEIRCNESCWNNESACNIKTELFKNVDFSNGISMQIDCHSNVEASRHDHLNDGNELHISAKYLMMPRFMGIQSVILDGCQTPLNAATFGLELLPICANITKAFIRHFNMDTLKPLYCKESPKQLHLEYLKIQFNEIAFIDKDSFSHNYLHLKNVQLEKNLLKVIHKDAFKSIRSLENLYIVNEPVLMLKFPDLFKYSSVVTLHLETLKQMTSDIFQHLPETLINLYVANTPLDSDAVFLRNPLLLRNLTIKNCALRKFTLRDVHSTVKNIDLSGNVMRTFTAYENNLKELNLSSNKLEWLPVEWMKNLSSLEVLILKANQIQTLSLQTLFEAIPNGQLFDLGHNRLQSLQNYENNIDDVQLFKVRLKCDQNPWDCLWLHEFAHYHPEKFRIFQYEKFISKINVNGLECIPTDKPLQPTKQQNLTNKIDALDKIVNVSAYTLVYSNSWEFKRNQRAEALIIVFMLPLGIALLFVLLYMWIYCQKMFHLSYYQDFSCMRRAANSTQHFDIVRQLTPRSNPNEPKTHLSRIYDETEEGYEIPINGLISECNCVKQHNTEQPAKCPKSVHITYEHLPIIEAPHQIYEEIIQEVGDRLNNSHSNRQHGNC